MTDRFVFVLLDYKEEQDLELEALESIYTSDYAQLSSDPVKLSLEMVPCPGESEENYVSVKAIFSLPETYPEVVPIVEFENVKGLKEEQLTVLQSKVEEEAENNVGMPMVYTLAEVVREWLQQNNVEEKTDESMYADMIARQDAIRAAEEKKQAAIDEETARQEEELKPKVCKSCKLERLRIDVANFKFGFYLGSCKVWYPCNG